MPFKMRAAVVFCAYLAACSARSTKQERRFPDEFIFGAATAAYQIEGAWNTDGKGVNIWDHYTHTYPDIVADLSNSDVAADTYHNYKRDVEMMRELGLDAYRFSMSWTRILPTGFSNQVSEAGVNFYNNYIDEMLKYNITPMVTIYHWDLPQSLQDLGGLTNPYFADWFEDYARVLYDNFGDRVKLWITFNEPNNACAGYEAVLLVPLLNATGFGDYLCAKNYLLAHARAYHAYYNDYKEAQGGEVGVTIYVPDYTPLTDSEEDLAATELAKQFDYRLFTEAIFSKDGGWPKDAEQRVNEKSAMQGYARSRLPPFTEEEIDLIKGTADFFGLNHYTGLKKSATEYKDVNAVPSKADDVDVGSYSLEEWPVAASAWLRLVPGSLYRAMMDVKNKYDNPIMYVTENGWSTEPGADLDDEGRITYYRKALDDVLDAIDDGLALKGYMAWSLMDNFEWLSGYTECFGLYDVDMESPERTRTARKSAYVYKEVIRSRVNDESYEPDISQPITIDEGH